MINFLMFLQPSPTPPGFDTSIVWTTIRGMGEGFLAHVPYLVMGLIVLVLFMIVGRLVRRGVRAAGKRSFLDETLADLLGRIAALSVLVFGVFVAGVIMFPGFKPGDLVTGLGITSVAIGFAFKDVLQNFFAGILLLWRRPFVVGDVIKTMNYEGTVEDINVRSTKLKTSDGERVVLPNGDVYGSAVLVRTAYDKRRLRFTVGIGYPDSIEEARELMKRVMRDTDGVLAEPAPAAYVSELADSSVNFNLLFWIDSRGSALQVSDSVASGIKNALDHAGIDIPFPHSVMLFHDTTGSRDGDIERKMYLGGKNGQITPPSDDGKLGKGANGFSSN